MGRKKGANDELRKYYIILYKRCMVSYKFIPEKLKDECIGAAFQRDR